MVSENPAGSGTRASTEGTGRSNLRDDFPALATRVHGQRLAYLDNAATTQVPAAVIDAVARFDRGGRANVRRGVHALSERATAAYEDARAAAARFVNAADPREIVFVRGATEAINLVARAYGDAYLRPGDEILVTELEHHANIVPWQMLCGRTGAVLRVAPVTGEGELRMDALAALVGPKTRVVAVAHVSNAIGTVNPVRAIADLAHARDAVVLVDGAQAAAHLPIDVAALGCDFYAFSGHKVYGPTGIGVLYGRADLLERMPPFLGGGDMVRSVSFERTTYDAPPHKFEAGTPNVEGAVGLAAAIAYLEGVGLEVAGRHEGALLAEATRRLEALPVRLVGRARDRAAIVSFVVGGVHAHDVGTILDRRGVAVRAGHHCAQPLLHRLGLRATVRASFALYNTPEDVDALVAGLASVREVLGP